MEIFKEFKGMVYELIFWEKLVPLPFNITSKLRKTSAAAYIFNKKNYFKGWNSKSKYGYK
jgi:hypothetical protein